MERFVEVQGVRVPRFIYGPAWKEHRTEGLTRLALEVGFRGIDTANQRQHYFEAGVGAAIAAAGIVGGGIKDFKRPFFVERRSTAGLMSCQTCGPRPRVGDASGPSSARGADRRGVRQSRETREQREQLGALKAIKEQLSAMGR